MKKILWDDKELKEIFSQNIDLSTPITGASIDTRTMSKGDMFFGIRGKNFDGNSFIDQAFSKGASLCFSDNIEKVSKINRSRVIKVNDIMQILNLLAKYRRKSLKAKVIAVTGSVGKTSTKEMMKIGLSSHGETFATIGNFNNHLGLCLSLINCPKDIKFCILELGMSASNEISELVEIVAPNISVITNVNPVHLRFLNSTLEIVNAKCEIFDNTKCLEYAFLNRDSLHYDIQLQKAASKGITVFTFGLDKEANCYIKEIHTLERVKIAKIICFGEEYKVTFNINVGNHLIYNSPTVFILAKVLGLDLRLIGENLQSFLPISGRGNAMNLPNNVKLIDESYNSNPTSLLKALQHTLSFRNHYRRVIAVLGDMKELGDNEVEYHKNIDLTGIDILFCVGPLMRSLYDNACYSNLIKKKWSENSLKMAQIVTDYIKEDDIILVKGSLEMRMKIIVETIKSRFKYE